MPGETPSNEINEYFAAIPPTFEQEREGQVLGEYMQRGSDYTNREIERLGREEEARSLGFKSLADAAEYERGLEQLKTMIPLQVAGIHAQGQQAARQAAAQRFAAQEAGRTERAFKSQEAQKERAFKAQQEQRARAVETGKTPIAPSGLWERIFGPSASRRSAEAMKLRSQPYQPSGDASMRQAAQIAVQKYGDLDPMEMLAAMGEDELTPEETQQFAELVAGFRGY
jgi:hypothetical protein